MWAPVLQPCSCNCVNDGININIVSSKSECQANYVQTYYILVFLIMRFQPPLVKQIRCKIPLVYLYWYQCERLFCFRVITLLALKFDQNLIGSVLFISFTSITQTCHMNSVTFRIHLLIVFKTTQFYGTLETELIFRSMYEDTNMRTPVPSNWEDGYNNPYDQKLSAGHADNSRTPPHTEQHPTNRRRFMTAWRENHKDEKDRHDEPIHQNGGVCSLFTQCTQETSFSGFKYIGGSSTSMFRR